jgi:haloacetate dehalogenase
LEDPVKNKSDSRRDFLQKAAGGALLAQAAGAQTGEPVWKTVFPAGFRNQRIQTSGAEINCVIGGAGPPALLLHGAPQSLLMWHTIAADLARDFTLVLCDLRGYGESSKPADQPNHAQQSKSAMALDGVEVMKALGHDRFFLVGHDRGGRVGRRMALDHPDKIRKLLVMDIVPAHYLYSNVTIEFVQAYFHWFNYLRPAPGPENELLKQNQAALARATNPVQRQYLTYMNDPATVHAMCEDYRASASISLAQDKADQKAGRKIQCPVHAVWAANGPMGKLYDVLGIWKDEAVDVTGQGLPGNHFLTESAPKETLAEIQKFLKA